MHCYMIDYILLFSSDKVYVESYTLLLGYYCLDFVIRLTYILLINTYN